MKRSDVARGSGLVAGVVMAAWCLALACVSGCETVKGLGRDITNLGGIFD